MVITEFDAGDPEATLHALAAENPGVPPGYAIACRSDRVGRRWRAILADGFRPYWHPRRTPELPDGAPKRQ